MNEPVVSILVPAYNVEQYIGICLESIITQTYRQLQVVIVDDGSTDSTGEICDKYASKYSFIDAYHIKNGGVANARNVLLSKAEGDFILFVDADDWIDPEMISNMVDISLKYSSDITVCGHIVDDSDNTGHTTIVKDENIIIWNQKECIEKFLRHKELNGSLWNKLIRRDLFDGIQFDKRISYGEDALVIWEVLKKSEIVAITNSKYYHYRINNNSISHQRFGKKKIGSHYVWEHFYNDTLVSFPEHQLLAKANFAVSDFWLLYFASMDGYAQDKSIKQFRKNVKDNIKLIYDLSLLSNIKIIAAITLAYAYPLIANCKRLYNNCK